MTRRRRSAKFKLNRGSVKALGKGVRVTLPYILSFGLLGTLFGASYAFALQGGLFTLQHLSVQGEQDSPLKLGHVTGLKKGVNLLSVDLAAMEKEIRVRFPEYRDVSVQRVLPDDIRIIVKKRQPLAEIRGDRYYQIDDEGMVVSSSSRRFTQATLIQGLDANFKFLKKGEVIRSRVLKQVLDVILAIQKKGFLNDNQLTAFDVSDGRNYKMELNGRIEVRLASRNITEQLKKLEEAMANGLQIDTEKIRYVDLRFDDIVIGPR
jgi:cell division septal protein FtsQ